MIDILFNDILTQLNNPASEQDEMNFDLAKKIYVYLIKNGPYFFAKNSSITFEIDKKEICLKFGVDVIIRPRREFNKRKLSFWANVNILAFSEEDKLLCEWAINTYNPDPQNEGSFNTFTQSQYQGHWDYATDNNGLQFKIVAKTTKALLKAKSSVLPINLPSETIQQLIKEMLPGRSSWVVSFEETVNSLPFIEGEDLFSYLIENNNDLSSKIFQYTIELYLAIHYMHLSGVAHLDIKPENIMVSKKDHLFLVDFQFSEAISSYYTTIKGSLGFLPMIFGNSSKIYTPNQKVNQDIFSALIVIALMDDRKISKAIYDFPPEINEAYLSTIRKIQLELKNTILTSESNNIVHKVGAIVLNYNIRTAPSKAISTKATQEILAVLKNHNYHEYQEVVENLLKDNLAYHRNKFPNTPLSAKMIYEIFLWKTEGNFEIAEEFWKIYKHAIANKGDVANNGALAAKNKTLINTINNVAIRVLETSCDFNAENFLAELKNPFVQQESPTSLLAKEFRHYAIPSMPADPPERSSLLAKKPRL